MGRFMNAQAAYIPLSQSIRIYLFIYLFFSQWFEVGGTQLEKGDVILYWIEIWG